MKWHVPHAHHWCDLLLKYTLPNVKECKWSEITVAMIINGMFRYDQCNAHPFVLIGCQVASSICLLCVCVKYCCAVITIQIHGQRSVFVSIHANTNLSWIPSISKCSWSCHNFYRQLVGMRAHDRVTGFHFPFNASLFLYLFITLSLYQTDTHFISIRIYVYILTCKNWCWNIFRGILLWLRIGFQ